MKLRKRFCAWAMDAESQTNFWRALKEISNKFGKFLEYCTYKGDKSKGCSPHVTMEEHMVSNTMELDLLDKKIRRLVQKLKKYNIDLEVFSHEDIEYGPVLGKGGEGIVRKCTVSYNGVPVEAAAKTVLDNSDDAISITLDEIELLCLAADPIIATTQRVYGVAAIPEDEEPEYGHLVIITEAGVMNTLQLYQQEQVPLYVTYDLWSRLAAGVHTMHSKKIIHQDLKPDNLLITAINRDNEGSIEEVRFKIIDLGMAKRVFTDKIVTDDIFGTNGYHPPEVLFEDTYDFRADIFMLGITFCVMLHSCEFLTDSSKLQTLLNQLHSAKQKKKAGLELFEEVLEPSIDHELSPEIKNMLCSMLENQCNRDVTLLDVMELCREQSSTLKAQHGEVFLSLGGGEGQRRAGRPPGGHDSGFGDHAHSGCSTTSGSNNKSGNRIMKRAKRSSSTAAAGGDMICSPRRTNRRNSSTTPSSPISPMCSRRSISSIVSDLTDDRRVTRSSSMSSMRSDKTDITVMSDITDLRGVTGGRGCKRMKDRTDLQDDNVLYRKRARKCVSYTEI